MKVKTLIAASLIFASGAASAHEGEKLLSKNWPFQGMTGSFDRQAAQRGYQVYKEVCSNCHSMKYKSFRNLAEIGFSEGEIKTIAAGYQVHDGPNDKGEMYDRAGRPSDHFPSPFPNEKAARANNNGAYPPDLSLIIKAREHGPDYVYSILQGYGEKPADMVMGEGMNYNKYFPGHQIAMPQPLQAGQVSYSDGTNASLEQMASDVVVFLQWAAEPEMEQRKRLGLKILLYLGIASVFFFLAKKKIWKDVE